MTKIKFTKKNIYIGDLILINPQNLLKENSKSNILESFYNKFANIKINKKTNIIFQFILKKINNKEEFTYIQFNGEPMKLELGYEDKVFENNEDDFIVTRYLS